jgi:hypothetical protein
MASELARQRYARKNEEDELERVFRTLDKNGDGKVCSEELGLIFQALGHKVGSLLTFINPAPFIGVISTCSPSEEKWMT